MLEDNKEYKCYNCRDNSHIQTTLLVSQKLRKEWAVEYCGLCGRVTNDIKAEEFHWWNAIPRIGMGKSVLITCLICTPAIFIAYKIGGLVPCLLVTMFSVWLIWRIGQIEFKIVDDCNFKRWEIHKELKEELKGENK